VKLLAPTKSDQQQTQQKVKKPEEQKEQLKFCTECGWKYRESDKFCGSCGHKRL